MNNTVTILGAKELYLAVKRLGALPQKCVTPAAKKGATVWLKAVQASAPVDTGDLKKGIILKGERNAKKGKKAYDVMFDPAMNDIFVKHHKASVNSSMVRRNQAKTGDTVRAYYPASQEFGFMTRNGGYVPGYHFMRDSATENAVAAQDKIVTELTKNIDKEWAKKNG